MIGSRKNIVVKKKLCELINKFWILLTNLRPSKDSIVGIKVKGYWLISPLQNVGIYQNNNKEQPVKINYFRHFQ